MFCTVMFKSRYDRKQLLVVMFRSRFMLMLGFVYLGFQHPCGNHAFDIRATFSKVWTLDYGDCQCCNNLQSGKEKLKMENNSVIFQMGLSLYHLSIKIIALTKQLTWPEKLSSDSEIISLQNSTRNHTFSRFKSLWDKHSGTVQVALVIATLHAISNKDSINVTIVGLSGARGLAGSYDCTLLQEHFHKYLSELNLNR
ncbi:hypothetical protein Lal_00025466 [Lupinus albus]|nr:hypothetical protein Lal_00025466 [Lupinus albus]